jgi:hypothetical protein
MENVRAAVGQSVYVLATGYEMEDREVEFVSR